MVFGKHFNKYYKKYGLALLFGILVLAILDWVQLFIPQTINTIITGVDENNETLNFVLENIFRILAFAAVITLGRFLWRHLLFGTSRKIETEIRYELFNHATKLSNHYYTGEKIGGLMSYFTNDLDAIRQSFGLGILMIVDGLLLIVLVLIRMFNIHAYMTLFAFIPLLLIGILLFFIRRKSEIIFKNRQEKYQELSDYTQERFSGFSVIKAYTKEIVSAITFDKRNKDLQDASYKFIKFIIVVNVIINGFIMMVIASVLIYGNYLILNGGMNAGTLTEYITYFFMLMWPISALSQFASIQGQAGASAKRITEFLDETIDASQSNDNLLKDVSIKGQIKLNDLSFSYPDGNGRNVLENLNLLIEAGQMVGVLGRTGSGKSSLVELLLKVYEASDNSILIDGFNINEIDTKHLRNNIGYVPQDNFLYSTTIEENIAFSSERIDKDRVVEVAKLSDVYENIMGFKEGFNTILGERGVTLSGGQRQRVSIARALYNNPPILILDDSVSAVDVDTEHEIINNLKQIRNGKTTILIAHRVSTVKELDKIILLDQGRLVGFDSHQNLLRENKLYQRLVHLQSLDELLED